MFGVAAGVGAIFFFGEVPRVRKDILMKLPWFDSYFDRTVAPEDNVSGNPLQRKRRRRSYLPLRRENMSFI